MTRLTDLIVPEVFSAYVVAKAMEDSPLCASGIVVWDPALDALAAGPGMLINMPYLMDLTGESEIMKDEGDLVPGKLVAGLDVARKLARVRGFGASGISSQVSGAHLMDTIGDGIAEWWVRDEEQTLLASLAGVFASESMADRVLDISTKAGDAALFSAEAFVDANQLMGDQKDAITAVMMHSAVEACLAKQALIDYEVDADKGVRVPVYMGKRVIVSDGVPYDPQGRVAQLYLFGEGAFQLGNGANPSVVETEVVRNGMASSGEEVLVSRRIFLLHPRGVRWTEELVEGLFPTNEELATGDNWQRVYDAKAVRLVMMKCKI